MSRPRSSWVAGCRRAVRAMAIGILPLALRAEPLATAAPPNGYAGDTSLTARIELLDPVTARPVHPEGGQAVRLRVHLSEPATGAAPRGLALAAFARPRVPGNSSCARAAQNFLTTFDPPRGSVYFTGMLVATLNRDSSVGIIDPSLNLYSANMLSAHRLADMPVAMARDRHMMRLLFATAAGELQALSLSGPDRTVLARGLGRITGLAVADSGRIWVGLEDALVALSPSGAPLERLPMVGPVRLFDRPDDPLSDLLIVRSGQGGIEMRDIHTGAVLMAARTGGPVISAAAVGPTGAETGVITLTPDRTEARIWYRDAPTVPVSVPLNDHFSRVTTGPDGRVALIWTPGDALMMIVDLGLGRVVQQVSLARDDRRVSISEVVMTDGSAFLLSHDGGFVAAMDLAAIGLGTEAVLRRSPFNLTARPPEGDTRLLAQLTQGARPMVMAVTPGNQTGWLVGDMTATVEMPSMKSVSLRGGVPQQIHAVDRSLVEVQPGVYETVWSFDPGPWELVLATRVGQLTSCANFDVRGDHVVRQVTPVMLKDLSMGVATAGTPHALTLQLVDRAGGPVAVDRLTLFIPSMLSGWTTRATARAGPDGRMQVQVTLPHAGPYALHPLDLPEGLALASATVIIAKGATQ